MLASTQELSSPPLNEVPIGTSLRNLRVTVLGLPGPDAAYRLQQTGPAADAPSAAHQGRQILSAGFRSDVPQPPTHP